MAEFRLLLADTLTGTVYDELTWSSFSYSFIMNRPGSGALQLPYRQGRKKRLKRSSIEPAKTSVYIERDKRIEWGGIVWTIRPMSDQKYVEVGLEGMWSYFRRRFIRHDRVYRDVDQFNIVRDLLFYAQHQYGGNIRMQIRGGHSGVRRDRSWFGYERKNLGEAIEQMTAVIDGFDFQVACFWSGSHERVVREFQASYPRQGQPKDLYFELGSTMRAISEYGIDATRMATLVDAIGEGDGPKMLISTAYDSSATAQEGYPLLETVTTYKDVKEPTTLQNHASADLAAVSRPVAIPSISVSTSQSLPYGSWMNGDTVWVRGHDGFIELDGQYRIMAWGNSVNKEKKEEIGFSFVDESMVTA